MACRRSFRSAMILPLTLLALAAWQGRALAQGAGGFGGAGGGGAGGSTGTGSTAVSGGFTGGAGGSGGGYTGGSSTGTGSTMATGGFTGGSSAGSSLGFTGGFTSGSSGTSTSPSSVNPFLSYYSNPLVSGMVNTSGQQTVNKPFGQAMYSTYSTAVTGTTTTGGFGGSFSGGAGGSFGGIGGTNQANNPYYAFNTFGMSRTPNYAATLGDGMPRVAYPNPQLQATVADVLRRSTYVQSTTPIKVAVKDSTVYLEGAVPTAKQRRLIEGLIRLTPGVQGVVNNLEVTETLPPPTKNAAPAGPK